MESVGRKRKCLSRKNPLKPHKQSTQYWKFLKPNSWGFLVNEVWWVSHLIWCCIQSCKARFEKKNGQDLDNICSKEVMGKDINWLARTYITTTGCPNKHGNSVTNSILSFLWIIIVIPNFKSLILLCLLEFILWKR